MSATAAPTTASESRLPDQPTPQSTVEAVMWTVRERGLKALQEPATQKRLRRCDTAAQEQIIQRIEKLHAAGRIPGGDDPVV
jgi:hypothetical protein